MGQQLSGEAMTWQPIETCPERTPVLVYFPAGRSAYGEYDAGCAVAVSTLRNGERDWDPVGAETYITEDIWVVGEPTHWQPLPEAPE